MQDTLSLRQNGTDENGTNGSIILNKGTKLTVDDIFKDVERMGWEDAILTVGDDKEFELRDVSGFDIPDRKVWHKEAEIIKISTNQLRNGKGSINGIPVSHLRYIFDQIEWKESEFPRLQVFYHQNRRAFIINKKPA